MGNIRSVRDVEVYNAAMTATMEIFGCAKAFPDEERYAMVDQMQRSSRSVCANVAEAWRRRRSEKYFRSKVGDAESEAEETCVWIEFAYRCEYLGAERAGALDETYDQLIGQRVCMRTNADDWVLRT